MRIINPLIIFARRIFNLFYGIIIIILTFYLDYFYDGKKYSGRGIYIGKPYH